MDNGKTAYRTIQGIIAAAVVGAGVCLYQWVELYQLRTLGTLPGCSINAAIDCAHVWNSALSTATHRITGIPLPGWGLIWSIAVIGLAVPLLIGMQARTLATRTTALRIVTGTGALVSLALGGYSVALGTFCPTCIIFYICTWAAAFLAFRYIRADRFDWIMGLAHSVGWVIVPLLLMVYPGQQTPQSIASITAPPPVSAPASTTPSAATSTPFAEQEDEVTRFVSGLSPAAQQALSDTLNAFRLAPVVERGPDAARTTFGNPGNGVHLVEWIDIKCPHCKSLFQALQEIRRVTRPETWYLESRNFPLDGNCNPGITQKQVDDVRCVAAKILICLSGSAREHEVRQKLFDAQETLIASKAWELAAADPQEKSKLESCVNDTSTTAQLMGDIEYANSHGIEGTPLVVINGRKTPAWPPLILALITANGDTQHPAFAKLPPPKPLPAGG